nr:meiosis arrest female protein 1-like [Ipomoea batatas]
MKPLFPRPVFTLFLYTTTKPPCCKLFQLSPFSAASHNHPSYHSRRHEDDGRNVKVSVWWDFENCSLPPAVNVFKVAHSITAAIRANGIKGPIQITAFGDIIHLPRPNQEALSSTGINLTHIPNGGKSSADRSLLVDLMYWVSQNPPPAHLFLITGDCEFAGILHRLRMNNYNILLATPQNASAALFSAASIMWQWNALLRGDDLTGKHFNHPPDGPYASWYGHYKAPLEDPFASTVDHQNSPHTDSDLSDSTSDPKPRPIPKPVTKYIRHILASNPKGLFITDLRAELAKSNLSIDKEFYGYKKFSRFLLAMPHVLKLQSGSGGQLLVQSVAPKSSEQNECSSGITVVEPTAAIVGQPDSITVRKMNGTKSSCTDSPNKMSSSISCSGPKVETPPAKLQESQKVQQLTTKLQHPLPKEQQSAQNTQDPTSGIQVPQGELPPSSIQITETKATGSQIHTAEDKSYVPKQGLFKRLWKKWFGSKKEYDANEKNCSSSDKIPAERTTINESDAKLASQSEHFKGLGPFPYGDEEKVDEKNSVSSQAIIEKSSSQSGFFNKIKNWCRPSESLSPLNNPDFESDEKVTQNKPGSGTHKNFSEDSFWKDMEAFLHTEQGSTLVLQSRTRLQLAQNLQQCGPSSLRSLCENDLLHLVDLFISDKKWVEERIQRTFPFKVSRSAVKAVKNASHSSTGLSSIFLHAELPTKLQEKDGEKKHQNPPHSGVSQPVTQGQGNSFGKSRNEVLVDCQKLVQEIVRVHPEGYNLGSFRKLFLEKYGYSLDLQKLGYQKLVNLLQIMPGIRIESNYMIPSGKDVNSAANELFTKESCVGDTVATSDSELLDASRKVDDVDSPWAELGPISKMTTLKKDEMEVGSSSRMDYEPLSDDDFSDMDEESLSVSSSTKRESAKPREKEESSLMQILDSWYSRKEESSGNGSSENVDGMDKCCKDNAKQSASSESVSIKSDSLLLSTGKRSKPSKPYSFVSDQPQDHKDELIDGILSSLNKSGQQSVEPKT